MICRRYYSSKMESDGSVLMITIPGINFATLPNLFKFDLVLCQRIPSGANTSEVILTDGTTKVVAYNLSGNLLRADQLRCRRCYPMVYGNDKEHVSMRRYLPNTSFSIPAPATFSGKKGQ